MTQSKPFISYAKEDLEWARRICKSLQQIGAQPWLDEFELLPGSDWKATILEALRSCSHFIALISENSVNKRGFVQRELKEALEILQDFPPGSIFILPVRLDQSEPRYPALKNLHRVDIFVDYEQSLAKIAATLGLTFHVEKNSGITWERSSSSGWKPVIDDSVWHLLLSREISKRLVFSEMDFYRHPNGQISSAVLADDASVFGSYFEMGDRIYFDEDGRIIFVYAYRGEASY